MTNAEMRRAVIELRGAYCRVCGKVRQLECDHIIPKGIGGSPSKTCVENGWILCRDHHEAKTRHRLRIRPEWLDDDQIEWLADQGHAWWEDGEVHGLHRRLFVPGQLATGGCSV